jgi:glycosyltransferase involved in cell wall biosynthesis
VSTSIGAEGLPLRDGEHLLLADTAAAFAEAVIRLLRDRAMADRLAQSASRFVAAHCSWDAVAQDFLAQCVPAPAVRGVSGKDLVT